VEKDGGVVKTDKRYLWCATELCEERDADGGTVLKHYYKQGVQDNNANFYYARDHLGSIRQVVNSAGAAVGRYGRQKIDGII
jgi:hypothetical protein